MSVINLDTLEGLPKKFLSKLDKYKYLLEKVNYADELENIEKLKKLIIEINEYCESNFVIGFHYTNANPDDILIHGLLSRNGETIREEFLKKYSNLFSNEEIVSIKNNWTEHYNSFDKSMRDNRIFFNFTLNAFPDQGAESLLNNFGGEQIYLSIFHIEGVREKLQKIGIPLILKCKLKAKNIKTIISYPWGKIVISTYQRLQGKNPEIWDVDQDGYHREPIDKSNIEILSVEQANLLTTHLRKRWL